MPKWQPKLLKKHSPPSAEELPKAGVQAECCLPGEEVQGQALLLPELSMPWPCTFCTGRVLWVTGASEQTPLPEDSQPQGISQRQLCSGGMCCALCLSLTEAGWALQEMPVSPHSQQWVNSLMFSLQQSSGSDFRLVYADWIGARTWKTPCLIDISSDFIPVPHSL